MESRQGRLLNKQLPLVELSECCLQNRMRSKARVTEFKRTRTCQRLYLRPLTVIKRLSSSVGCTPHTRPSSQACELNGVYEPGALDQGGISEARST